jgi:hypothetical protein
VIVIEKNFAFFLNQQTPGKEIEFFRFEPIQIRRRQMSQAPTDSQFFHSRLKNCFARKCGHELPVLGWIERGNHRAIGLISASRLATGWRGRNGMLYCGAARHRFAHRAASGTRNAYACQHRSQQAEQANH